MILYHQKLVVYYIPLPPSTYLPSGRKNEGAAPEARAAFHTNWSSGRELVAPGEVALDNSGWG